MVTPEQQARVTGSSRAILRSQHMHAPWGPHATSSGGGKHQPNLAVRPGITVWRATKAVKVDQPDSPCRTYSVASPSTHPTTQPIANTTHQGLQGCTTMPCHVCHPPTCSWKRLSSAARPRSAAAAARMLAAAPPRARRRSPVRRSRPAVTSCSTSRVLRKGCGAAGWVQRTQPRVE
jgi:hypothetical protein